MKRNITNPNTSSGENKVFLQGITGILGVINIPDKSLDDMKNKQILINKASIRLYVDNDDDFRVPNKIDIYNLDEDRQIDTYVDEDLVGGGYDAKNKYYEINISKHINNIINRDSTNVKLGLRVEKGGDKPYRTVLSPAKGSSFKIIFDLYH